jgi:hypothetical protein
LEKNSIGEESLGRPRRILEVNIKIFQREVCREVGK